MLTFSGHADEGMWPLDKLPGKQMQAAYGFVPDAKWLEHARLASVQYDGGCSGSFVSPNGLIMTNHHCVVDCLRTLSAMKKTDYWKSPFVAKTSEQEVKCPATEANQLLQTTDVTEAVRAGTKGVAALKFHDAFVKVASALEKACTGTDIEGTRCEVIDLYHGGQYVLHRYKRYQDIRLVFSPEDAIASLGGDVDNFQFPRFALDAAFTRAYENGKPASSPHFFGWRTEGAKEGELTFVTGHPGGTDRLLTVAELEQQRDVLLPTRLQESQFRRGMLHELARASAHGKSITEIPLSGLENGLKVWAGEYSALLEPRLLERKRQEEQALRAAVAKDPVLSKELGDPWAEIAALVVKENARYPRSRAMRIDGNLFHTARTLVRGAAQRELPEGERFPEYADRGLADIAVRLGAPSPMFPELEERSLINSLTRMRDLLGVDDAQVKLALGTHSPDLVAREAVKGTVLFDPKVRAALWAGGQRAIDASKDPVIALAKKLEPAAVAMRKTDEAEISGPMQVASERVAKAYFTVHRQDTYPDATYTLRLSYGRVRGWLRRDNVQVAPFTTLGGTFEHATGEAPFDLPKSWLTAKSKINGSLPFNFVTDNDIVGGNSGSPMIDKEGRIIGLAFDGNSESIGGNFWFDEKENRTVGVHPAAIIEALRVVYGAGRIADELTH